MFLYDFIGTTLLQFINLVEVWNLTGLLIPFLLFLAILFGIKFCDWDHCPVA